MSSASDAISSAAHAAQRISRAVSRSSICPRLPSVRFSSVYHSTGAARKRPLAAAAARWYTTEGKIPCRAAPGAAGRGRYGQDPPAGRRRHHRRRAERGHAGRGGAARAQRPAALPRQNSCSSRWARRPGRWPPPRSRRWTAGWTAAPSSPSTATPAARCRRFRCMRPATPYRTKIPLPPRRRPSTWSPRSARTISYCSCSQAGAARCLRGRLIDGGALASVTKQLLACGADIVEMNTVRKRLSAVKGGRFAQLCAPAHVFSVVLSRRHRRSAGHDRLRPGLPGRLHRAAGAARGGKNTAWTCRPMRWRCWAGKRPRRCQTPKRT